MRKLLVTVIAFMLVVPAQAAVTFYTSQDLFLQDVRSMLHQTAVQNDWVSQGEAVAVSAPATLGQASISADQMVLYDDGGYGTTVYLGVSGFTGQAGITQITSGDAFVGLDLGSLLGDTSILATINGDSRLITISDSGDTFFGAIDTSGLAITGQLVQTSDDELDILHTYTSDPSASAVPEPAGWAMMIGGLLATGAVLRRRTRAIEA